MKEFHREYAFRPTETEKKGRKSKTPKEPCKCYAPLVKLHYYDCPAVKKLCPVHGHPHVHEKRDEKGEQPEQSMIISFHPSSKTERLFQPVKALLAQCDPETKVNLQYYSSNSTTSKESVKNQAKTGKPINNNVFVEKTKSSVSDKTNKMKKLKQCFHSPCNSIAQKSRSQTSVREKFQEMFQEERKRANEFGKLAPDKPPDDIKCDPPWLSSKFDFNEWEKLSGQKTDSDFITITQQARNNLINHKIFEIKHKKGLADLPFVRLPKQPTQLVYSSIDVDRALKENQDSTDPDDRKRIVQKESPGYGEEVERKEKGDDEVSSEDNFQTSSSSSVYFTPFIFVPAAAESDSEGKPKAVERADKGVQVGEPGYEKKGSLGTQTPSAFSEDIAPKSGDSKTRSVLVQTDLDRQSGDSVSQGWYLRNIEVAESFTTRGTQTDEGLYPSDKNMGDYRSQEEFSDDLTLSREESYDNYKKDKQIWTSTTHSVGVQSTISRGVRTIEVTKSVEVQTNKYYRSSNSSTPQWSVVRINKNVQTETLRVEEVGRIESSKTNKSQMAPKLSNKKTQTSFSQEESTEEESEFINLDSSNVTYVSKPFGQQESEQAIDKLAKAWWGKSHSDSDLTDNRKCECGKPEYLNAFPGGSQSQESEGVRESTPSSKPSQKQKTPRKVDKALGTDDGTQRLYRRAEKGLGTDSWPYLPPETPQKETRREGTKTKRSPRTPERIPVKEESPHSPRTALSDLSELSKIIQDFFEKKGMTSTRSCACETPAVSGRRAEPGRTAPDSRKPKKEFADGTSGTTDKVDSETMTDVQRRTNEFVNAEIQVSSSPRAGPATGNRTAKDSDQVKIRRSVLLDEAQSKTRFVCSVCARKISIYTKNATTNTENTYNSRKNEKPSEDVEISELVKPKTVRMVQSYDPTNRSVVSAPEERRKCCSDRCTPDPFETPKPSRDCSQSPNKSGIPISKPSGSDRITRETQSNRQDSARQIPTTSSSLKPSSITRCACKEPGIVCTVNTCPNREPPSGSRSHQQKPDTQTRATTENPGVSDPSRAERKPLRRNPEHYYPVIIQSLWPKELAWSFPEQSTNIHNSKTSAQQKRSLEKDTEPAEIPAGKKIKAETEKPPRQCFMFGDPASSDFRLGDRTVVQSKGNLFWIPSLSASHVSPPRKHALAHSKTIKSEEKVREEDNRQCPVSSEEFLKDGSPDLLSAKSCHLTPIALGCDSKHPFDKLFECRVCKSLTFLKNDKDQVFFHLPHGLFAYCPEEHNATARRVRGEEDSSPLEQNESSTQNLEKLLEQCSRCSERSYFSSPEELLEEKPEEEPEVRTQRRDIPPSIDDIFFSNAAASSRSFNKFWLEGYSKKK